MLLRFGRTACPKFLRRSNVRLVTHDALEGGDFMTGMMRGAAVQSVYQTIKAEYDKAMELPVGSSERQKALQEVHERSAPRCLELARRNGGVYNKAAQFVASLQGGAGSSTIPEEYTKRFAELTDKAPGRPLAKMERVFQADFGKGSEELFQEIDPEPINAASIAQVHRAVLKDGTTVAVKIQYPEVKDNMAADLRILEMVAGQIKPAGFDLTWAVNDFKVAFGMEVDFTSEGHHTDRAAKLLSHRDYIHVPKVFWEHSSPRVLCFEFVDGLHKLNKQTLQKFGWESDQVGHLVSAMSAEMIFRLGCVHGDPHLGNVYVREHPNQPGKPQLVLLDHGLYHCVDKISRHAFCQLVVACIENDPKQMEELSTHFAGPLHRFFPLILSPWFVLASKCSASDIMSAVNNRLPDDVTLEDVGHFVVGMHKGGTNMLGVLHSMGYIRGLLNSLGASEKVQLLNYCEFAVEGLQEDVEVEGPPSNVSQREKRLEQMKNTKVGGEGASDDPSLVVQYDTRTKLEDIPTFSAERSQELQKKIFIVQQQVEATATVLKRVNMLLPLLKVSPGLVLALSRATPARMCWYAGVVVAGGCAYRVVIPV